MFKARQCCVWWVGLLALALAVGLQATPVQAAYLPSDISGHWAGSQIADLVEQGVVSGNPDGTFAPDRTITRAEYMVMLNRAFGFSSAAEIRFSDVDQNDWYAPEIAKAMAAGYLSGYGDGTVRPNTLISRQEMAVMLARAMDLTLSGTGELERFKDSGTIPDWSAPACAALVGQGFMSGYPDGSFAAQDPCSRAMAAVTVDKCLSQRTIAYNTAGTYGPETGSQVLKGNAVVNAGPLTLRNLVIEGNLIIAGGAGQADVSLQNVTVKGRVIINGGEVGLNGVFNEVFMQENNGTLTFSGEAASVIVNAPTSGAFLDFASGHIGRVTVAAGTQGTRVNIAKGMVIDNFYSYAVLDATGSGTVHTSYIYVSGITSTLRPDRRVIAANCQPPTNPEVLPGGGGGGGGGYTGPTLGAISVGGIKPVESGTMSAPFLLFDVDPATLYTTGTAGLNTDVSYEISSSRIPFFAITGTASRSDNLTAMALSLLGTTPNGGSAADGGVRGQTLIDFSDLTITLTAGTKQTVYTVRFV